LACRLISFKYLVTEMQIWQRLVKLENDSEDFGLAWPNALEILNQIESECLEIREHLESGDDKSLALEEEIGDLMHAVMSLSWFCGFDSLSVLEKSCNKFELRLNTMKAIAQEKGLENVKHYSFEELMLLWKLGKERIKILQGSVR